MKHVTNGEGFHPKLTEFLQWFFNLTSTLLAGVMEIHGWWK